MVRRVRINALVMDDDFFALQALTVIVARDRRARVVGTADAPGPLLELCALSGETTDVILDAEFCSRDGSLAELITAVRQQLPHANVICLSQYGHPDTLKAAVDAGATGFLMKDEVRVALVPALRRAVEGQLVVSESLFAQAHALAYPRRQVIALPSWRISRFLSPQIERVFWLRVVYGLRAVLVAEELRVKVSTIEKYVSNAYTAVGGGLVDELDLSGLEDADRTLHPEDWAYAWFTALPLVI